MNRQERRATAAQLKKDNKKQPDELEVVPTNQWPYKQPGMSLLLRSSKYLVQVYFEKNDIIRLSVCRTQINNQGEWQDNITWEELQEIKKQSGFAQNDAIEVYPRDEDVVNVANMRHLWVLPVPLAFAWRKGEES